MKKTIKFLSILFAVTAWGTYTANAQANDLRIVFIRHGEKPVKGDNLNCQGLNRSLKLPAVLFKKFGVPSFTFVPAIGLGESTKHSRMFQTIIPMAAKYNLTINSSHQERDSLAIAADLKTRTGTVLILWEHKGISPIVKSLGIQDDNLKWPDDDYDSIWIVTFKDGIAKLEKDKENINPANGCEF